LQKALDEIISDLNFCNVPARWVPKIRGKRRLLSLEIFAVTNMKENRSWMKRVYDFTPAPKRNSIIWKHPHSLTTPTIYKFGGGGNHVLGLRRPHAV
jgi:hypothetical protein